MTKVEAIEKIKKCLALSASSNEHEAERALSQARALMDKFQIDDADMLAAGAGEFMAKAGTARRPTNYEQWLACKIADAFGCDILFTQGGFFDTSGHWKFIGCGPSPEIAGYAFAVLYRQLKRARAEHIKLKLKRCKSVTKTRRADLFCEGWVTAVAGKITAFSGGEEQKKAIAAYMSKHYPVLNTTTSRDRNGEKAMSNRDYNDYIQGKSQGKNAQLNHGVDGQEQELLR